MLVRPARLEDVSAVLPMVRAICQLHRQWDVARYDYDQDPAQRYAPWLRERVTDGRSVFLVAAVDDGMADLPDVSPSPRPPSSPASPASPMTPAPLAGFVVATIEREIPIYRLEEYGFVHDLWVEPWARGRGVARAMSAALLEAFDDKGVAQVRLSTAAPNDAARRLFTACGFRPATIEMLRERARP